MLREFFTFEIKNKLKYFSSQTTAKTITSTLFLVVFLVVGMGIYSFFVSGFRYINVQLTPDIQVALTLFIYEMFLMVLSILIVIGALITSLFNLFKSDSNAWIISTPGYELFPKIIYIRTLLSSLFISLILFIPAILAFDKIYHLSGTAFLFIMLSIFVFLIGLTSLTLFITILLANVCWKLFTYLKVRFSFTSFVVTLTLLLALVSIGTWQSARNVDLVTVFKAEEDVVALSEKLIGSHFSYLPSHPFAMEIMHWQNNNTKGALTYFFILLAMSLVLTGVLWNILKYYYQPWLSFQDGKNREEKTSHTPAITFGESPTASLFKKESLLFVRNIRGLIWFAFLLFIWGIQIATNYVLKSNIARSQLDISEKTALLIAFEFLIALYFICAFALRFVFPAFSTEKKTSWIIYSAPLSFKKLFYGKYIFYTSLFTLLGLCMGYVAGTSLNVNIIASGLTFFIFIINILTIVTFALSLGVLFPNKDTDDAEAISTSVPGLLFTGISLSYGALSSWALYQFTVNNNSLFIILSGISIFLIAICLVIVPNKALARNIL